MFGYTETLPIAMHYMNYGRYEYKRIVVAKWIV